MGIRITNYILATLGLGGHVALFIVLIRHKLAVRLPLFTILIVFYLLRSGILFVGNFKSIRPWAYWLLIALDPLLQLALGASILYAWRPSPLKSNIMGVLSAVTLLAVAAGLSGLAAWYLGPSSHFSPENLSIKAGIFISVLWIGVGLALPAIAAGQLRPLPALTQKVVRGFAIYSAANVLTEIGHRQFAAMRAAALPYLGFSYLRVVAYLLCLWLWIAACTQEPAIDAKPHPGDRDAESVLA